MRKLFKVAALVAALFGVHGHVSAAGAAGIVFDPTDFIKDIATAKQTLITASNAVQQTAHQYAMVKSLIQDLSQMNVGSLLGQLDPNVAKQYSDYQKFYKQLRNLEQDIDNLEKRFHSKAASAFSAKMTIGEYVKFQQQQAADGQAVAQASLDADVETLKRVEKTYDMVQHWQSQIPGIDGSVKGLQLLNSQMSAMLAQNAEIVTALTRDRMAKTLDKVDEDEKRRISSMANGYRQGRKVSEQNDLLQGVTDEFKAIRKPDRFK